MNSPRRVSDPRFRIYCQNKKQEHGWKNAQVSTECYVTNTQDQYSGVSGAAGSFSRGFGEVLFAEQDLQQPQFSFELFVFLVFLLHGTPILFLADSVKSGGKTEANANVKHSGTLNAFKHQTFISSFHVFGTKDVLVRYELSGKPRIPQRILVLCISEYFIPFTKNTLSASFA